MLVRPLPELAIGDLFLAAIDPGVEIPRGNPNDAHAIERARTQVGRDLTSW